MYRMSNCSRLASIVFVRTSGEPSHKPVARVDVSVMEFVLPPDIVEHLHTLAIMKNKVHGERGCTSPLTPILRKARSMRDFTESVHITNVGRGSERTKRLGSIHQKGLFR